MLYRIFILICKFSHFAAPENRMTVCLATFRLGDHKIKTEDKSVSAKNSFVSVAIDIIRLAYHQ